MKHIIFDFGNVLARFDAMQMTGAYFDDPELCKKIGDIVFDRLYWDKLDRGTITNEEVLAGIRSRVPAELAERACAVFIHWPELIEPIAGMPELVADLKRQGYGLYLLSDISIEFSENYEKIPWIKALFALFDGLMMSGPVGLVKPHRETFENLLHTFDLRADDCLFIDDRAVNIAGAEACGIRGYVFDGNAEKLRCYLQI